MTLLDADTDDPSSAGFDHVSADDGIGGPVCALDEHIRLQGRDDVVWRVLVEDDAGINDGESSDELGALGLGCHRPVGSLVRANRSIRIDTDNERVAFLPGGAEIAHVSWVQQVEDTVREDDDGSVGTNLANERYGL